MKLFSLINSGKVHLDKKSKILKSDDYKSILDSKEIIQKAKDDAKELLEKTQKECEGLKKEAAEQGFQEGLAQLNEKLIALDETLKIVQHETQAQVLSLAMKVSKKVVAEEITTNPEVIMNIVRQTVQPVTSHHHVKIIVSKKDKKTLKEKKPEIQELFEKLDSLIIEEKADMEDGSCIIETESGIINATIENQWRALESAFERHYQ